MPAATFRPVEVTFLRPLIPRWEEMKKKRANERNVDQLLKERTQFIRKVCTDFLAKFPERDPSISDPGALTFSEEDIAKFPQRGGTRVAEMQAIRRKTHGRNLATQRYKQQINDIAREIRLTEPELKQMTAFNKATTQFMEQLKAEDPEQYDKLHQDAAELRAAAGMDYADMSPDVLARLLSEFPQRFMDEVEEHGRNLPVHIWSIVALGVPPSNQIKLYSMSTRSIEKIQDSGTNQMLKEEFSKWLKDNLGLFEKW
ncbi:hypothetical protein FRC11_006402 [Ceratobasidium sp. 423]|nr:hypothetical protein FRC11_006402 [Ceratobasidium sp. 423]